MLKFLHLLVLFCSLICLINCKTTNTRELPTAEDSEEVKNPLIESYHNYRASLVAGHKKTGYDPARQDQGGYTGPSITSGSTFGPSYILALLNEKLWKVTAPGFEYALKGAPENLPDSYETMLNTIAGDANIKITNTIYSPTTEPLKLLSPAEEARMKKLKVEMVTLDFTGNPVGHINQDIVKKSEPPTGDSYIGTGMSLSKAAKAVIISTVRISEPWWKPLRSVGPSTFNGNERAEMIELSKGQFHFIESKKSIQVIIPFKNEKRFLSLILPSEQSGQSNADEGQDQENENEHEQDDEPEQEQEDENSDEVEADAEDEKDVRVHIPAFSFTLRTLHKGGPPPDSIKCEEHKEPNFFQILDDIAYVSFDVNKFEAIAVAGGQINDGKIYREDVGIPIVPIIIPPAQNAQDENGNKIVGQVPASLKTKRSIKKKKLRQENEEPRIVVFNRSFSWSVVDENLGPIFSGQMDSLLVPPQNARTAVAGADNEQKVFGYDKYLSFLKCF